MSLPLGVAHASRVLVSASRRNSLSFWAILLASNAPRKVRDREDAFANTQNACATQNVRGLSRLSPSSRVEDGGEGLERTRAGLTLTLPLSLCKGEATQHTHGRSRTAHPWAS